MNAQQLFLSLQKSSPKLPEHFPKPQNLLPNAPQKVLDAQQQFPRLPGGLPETQQQLLKLPETVPDTNKTSPNTQQQLIYVEKLLRDTLNLFGKTQQNFQPLNSTVPAVLQRPFKLPQATYLTQNPHPKHPTRRPHNPNSRFPFAGECSQPYPYSEWGKLALGSAPTLVLPRSGQLQFHGFSNKIQPRQL